MDDKAWNVTNTITLPSGEEMNIEGPITAIEVNNAAKAAGILKFVVTDEEGRPLKPIDFPLSYDIIVEEYNEAK